MFSSDETYKFVINSLKHPKGSRSFLNGNYTDAERWSSEVREWAFQKLLYNPGKVPLNMQVLEEVKFDKYTRKRIVFDAAPDCKVSAYLLVPVGLKQPAPAIAALHDHTNRFYWGKDKLVDHRAEPPGLREFQALRYGGRGYASALAERGYVVAVIDALGFGERGWTPETWLQQGIEKLKGLEEGSPGYVDLYDEIWYGKCNKAMETILYAGMTYMGITVWEDMRTIDLLCSLPEVDPERVACLGLSMGGYRTAWLGAMDERIKCACSVCWMTRMEDKFPHRQMPLFGVVPGLYNSLPFPELAALMVPRSFLVLYGENDELFDMSSTEKACDTIGRVYVKAGSAGSFEARGYPCGHQFSLRMQEEAFSWLDALLKPGGQI